MSVLAYGGPAPPSAPVSPAIEADSPGRRTANRRRHAPRCPNYVAPMPALEPRQKFARTYRKRAPVRSSRSARRGRARRQSRWCSKVGPRRGSENGRRRARIRAKCSGSLPVLAIGFLSRFKGALPLISGSLRKSQHRLQLVSPHNGAVTGVRTDAATEDRVWEPLLALYLRAFLRATLHRMGQPTLLDQVDDSLPLSRPPGLV